jgi:hypothetical protein
MRVRADWYQALGGTLAFSATDVTAAVKKFTACMDSLAHHGLPSALGIQRSIFNSPHDRISAIGFVWSSGDHDEGRSYLKKVAAFGDLLANTVEPTTIPIWVEASASSVSETACGASYSISIREITDRVAEVIGREIAKMPADPATLI